MKASAHISFILLLFNTFLFAQWPNLPNENLRICYSDGVQSQHQFVSDSSGGFIVTWADTRNSANDYQIYAQRVSADGHLLWDSTGVAICTDTLNQWTPSITSDQKGGAIITWSDYRNGGADIYAQRINSSGQVLWQTNGVIVCDENRLQSAPVLISDENSGAIITWIDNRGAFGTYDDIYIQRVDSSGNAAWTVNGIRIHDDAGEERYPQIIPDGNGGAIVSWWTLGQDIYAQNINSSGSLMWPSMGVQVSINGTNYPVFKLVSDENGGAIVVWRGNVPDISARRIDAGGNYVWSDTSETLVCINPANQATPHAASDGNGGVYITWVDSRSGTNADIYGQHVSGNGNLMWSDDGILLSDYNTYIPNPRVVAGSQNNAYFAWVDQRNGNALWSQKILADSTDAWGHGGVHTAVGVSNTSDVKLMSDGSDNLFALFTVNTKVYAKKVLSDGSLGVISSLDTNRDVLPQDFITLSSYPNPFNPTTTIKYTIPSDGFVNLHIFNSIGEKVKSVVSDFKKAGRHKVFFDGSNLSSGIYFYNIEFKNANISNKMILLR